MHVGDESGSYVITLVTERTQQASESIFALLDSKSAKSLRLHHSESDLWVTDVNGVYVGRCPKGHPATKPQTGRLEIGGFDVIGNADEPTRPNLIIEVRTVHSDDSSGEAVC